MDKSPCNDCVCFPICKNQVQDAVNKEKFTLFSNNLYLLHIILINKCSIYYESIKKNYSLSPEDCKEMAMLTYKLMEIDGG